MKKLLSVVLMLALLVIAGRADCQVVGNPNHKAKLEFIYSDMNTAVQIDGEFLEADQSMKVTKEYGHGKHLIQIYARSGFFGADLKEDGTIDLPGGYITRATAKNHKLVILETIPIPGLAVAPAPAPAPVATGTVSGTTTTTTTNVGMPGMTMQVTVNESQSQSGNVTTQVNVGGQPAQTGNATMTVTATGQGQTSGTTETVTIDMNPFMGIGATTTVTTTQTGTTTPAPAPTPPPAPVKKNSKLIFITNTSFPVVTLDGKPVAEFGVGGISEPQVIEVNDVKPSTYKCKVTCWSDVWFDGTLKVGNGEEIKISIEPPKTFEIISRDPID